MVDGPQDPEFDRDPTASGDPGADREAGGSRCALLAVLVLGVVGCGSDDEGGDDVDTR